MTFWAWSFASGGDFLWRDLICGSVFFFFICYLTPYCTLIHSSIHHVLLCRGTHHDHRRKARYICTRLLLREMDCSTTFGQFDSIHSFLLTLACKHIAKDRAVHVGFCCKCKHAKSTITVRYAEYCEYVPIFICFLDCVPLIFYLGRKNDRSDNLVSLSLFFPTHLSLAWSPCFLIALDSKFRTALRNARPYRVITPENVMLAFSGGPSSR